MRRAPMRCCVLAALHAVGKMLRPKPFSYATAVPGLARSARYIAVFATVAYGVAFALPFVRAVSRWQIHTVVAPMAAYQLAMALLYWRSAAWLDDDKWEGAALSCGLSTLGFLVAILSRDHLAMRLTDVIWLACIMITVSATRALRLTERT